MVEPLSVATGGQLETGALIGVSLGPEGVPIESVSRRSEMQLEKQFGVDLEMTDDLVVGADNDLMLTRGLEGLRASLARSIVTAPGEIPWRAAYGVGATEFLGTRVDAANLGSLQSRIRSSLLGNSAVEEIVGPRVTLSRSQPALIDVETSVVISGQSQPIALRMREV